MTRSTLSRNQRLLLLSAAGVLLCLEPRSAWTADGGDSATTVSPLIISANPVPTPASEVASSVTLVTAQDFDDLQERTAPDVLSTVPGLNIVQTGGPGGVASVFIRGADSNHTKVVVDGIDVSDPSTPTGAFDFSNLLTAGLERVEVLRGPQSGLYGSDAIGGVVDVQTLAGSGPARLEGSLEAGSFATFNQTGAISGSTGPFSYRFDADHLHVGAIPVTPLELLAPGEARNDDQYDNVTLATKLGLALPANANLGLVARFIDADLRFTGTDDFGPYPDPLQSQSRTVQLFTRLTASQSYLDGRFTQTLGLGYTYYRTDGQTPDFGSSVDTGQRIKLDWRGNITLAAGEVLALGAEHQIDSIDQSPISASMTNDAGSIQLQSSVGGVFFDTLSVRYDANDRFGGAVTYRIAPAFLIAATGTKLKASLGTGFKAPTLDELFVSYPDFDFFANPDLKPETSTGYDLGFEQQVPGARAQFGATYFHNAIRNLINDNADFTTYVNVGRATTLGVESFAAWRPFDQLTLRADYTYTWAEDDIAHQELLRRPKNKASVTAQWRVTRALLLTATELYVGPWIDGNRDFSIPRLTAPGYATLDVTASYAVTPKVSVFGRVTNLLDRHYENPIGFDRPGLGAFAGVKGSF
jgi:vitamin B12 transporter